MKQIINFYNVLDEELLEKSDINIDYSLNYVKKQENIKIKTIEKSGIINLDAKSGWDKQWDKLFFNLQVEVKKANMLYGVNAIAPKTSRLAFALEFLSRTSKTRKVLKADKYILNKEGSQKFNFEFEIKNNEFDDILDINLIVYLESKSNKIEIGEDVLNNNEGVTLGFAWDKKIMLSGVGSLFPIYIQPLKSNRLWELELNYSDPYVDTLFDSMKLIINSNHKDYPLVDGTETNYTDGYINDIVANSISLLLNQLLSEGYLSNIGDNNNKGSIMSFVEYYTNVLELKINTPFEIQYSIRQYLYSK